MYDDKILLIPTCGLCDAPAPTSDVERIMQDGWQQIQSSGDFCWVCPECSEELPRW